VVVTAMSRIADAQRVSLQFVSASTTLQVVDAYVVPSVPMPMGVEVAPMLEPGAIAPDPPFRAFSVAALGALPMVQIQTFAAGTSDMTSTVMLSTILAGSGLTTSDVANEANLVFVAVGSGPGVSSGPFWHALTYALVKANPG
jgi:hypothetical protein